MFMHNFSSWRVMVTWNSPEIYKRNLARWLNWWFTPYLKSSRWLRYRWYFLSEIQADLLGNHWWNSTKTHERSNLISRTARFGCGTWNIQDCVVTLISLNLDAIKTWWYNPCFFFMMQTFQQLWAFCDLNHLPNLWLCSNVEPLECEKQVKNRDAYLPVTTLAEFQWLAA